MNGKNIVTPKYLYVALARKKDNIGLKREMQIREIEKPSHSSSDAIVILKQKCVNRDPSVVWRIYRTVNRRDEVKARQELMIYLVKHPNEERSIASWYKTLLHRPNCKYENFILLDVDTVKPSEFDKVLKFIKEHQIELIEPAKPSPNGYHFIVKGFNKTLLTNSSISKYVTWKKDAMVFVEIVEPIVEKLHSHNTVMSGIFEYLKRNDNDIDFESMNSYEMCNVLKIPIVSASEVDAVLKGMRLTLNGTYGLSPSKICPNTVYMMRSILNTLKKKLNEV